MHVVVFKVTLRVGLGLEGLKVTLSPRLRLAFTAMFLNRQAETSEAECTKPSHSQSR